MRNVIAFQLLEGNLRPVVNDVIGPHRSVLFVTDRAAVRIFTPAVDEFSVTYADPTAQNDASEGALDLSLEVPSCGTNVQSANPSAHTPTEAQVSSELYYSRAGIALQPICSNIFRHRQGK